VHPDHPDVNESGWIDRVTSFLDVPVERLEVRGGSALAAALEYQLAWEVPAGTAMLAFNAPLLRRAAADGVGVLLDGEGGDELLGCSEYVVADRVRRLDLRGAVSLAGRLPGAGVDPGARFLWALLREFGLRGAAPHGLHQRLRRLRPSRYAPRWLQPEAAAEYVELRDDWAWKRLDGPPSWRYLADLLTDGRERLGVHDLLRRRATLAGIASSHPLLEDLELVELVLRLPPELQLDPVLTRPLAREAMAGLLPDDVRLRPDKVDFTVLVVESLSGPDRPTVEDLLGRRDAEVLTYVRPESVRSLLDTPPSRRSAEWARVLSRLATTEAWLRSQADPKLSSRLLDGLSASGPSPRADGRGASA
jgi:asparagine synthase (glutamine-hydrolysing)